jgi:hypothetical protein
MERTTVMATTRAVGGEVQFPSVQTFGVLLQEMILGISVAAINAVQIPTGTHYFGCGSFAVLEYVQLISSSAEGIMVIERETESTYILVMIFRFDENSSWLLRTMTCLSS